MRKRTAMTDDRDKYKHPEPYKTKVRDASMSRAEARKWLDQGGHLEAPEEALYRHMRESQRRLMVMLPTLLWTGVTHMRENLGIDIDPSLQISLERSAEIAVRYLVPITAEETLIRIMADAEAVLKEMDGDNIPQAVTGAAHLITALVDQGRIPDPTAQSVLVSLAILTEAENDKHEGIRGTWGYSKWKLNRMMNRGIKKLAFRGYL